MDCVRLLGVFLVVAGCYAEQPSPGVAPRVKLSDGREMPTLGLGTWLGFTKSGDRVTVEGDQVRKALEYAIDAGYRHIDTAAIYNTEAQVGQGVNNKIKEGVIKRSDVFITTKLWNDQHAKEAVVPALKRSLEALNLTYVDLYIIHWPVALKADGSIDPTTDYVDTWQGMIQAKELGLTKSIGVSNFNVHQLERLVASSPVKPVANQVELNLNLQQPALLEYCKKNDIAVVGYTPFGSLFHSKAAADAPSPRTDEQALLRIAGKYNKTVPQIALRYLVEIGVTPIPKSITKSRLQQNLDIFDFQLTPEERQLMKGYDKNYRTIPVKNWLDSPYYPFEKN